MLVHMPLRVLVIWTLYGHVDLHANFEGCHMTEYKHFWSIVHFPILSYVRAGLYCLR